jgi:acetyl esterase/lipase
MIRYALALSALLVPAMFAQAPKPNPRDARIAEVVTVDGAPGGWVQTMDYYAPAGPGPHPAVVIVHGGGFTGGTSRNGSEAYCADFLAPAGYAVFSVNYRLAPEFPLSAQIADVERGIRWVSEHAAKYDVDPRKIVLLGGSAGGYLSNMIGVAPSRGVDLAAVVTLYGISDLSTMSDPDGLAKRKLLGDQPATPYAMRNASPIAHVGAGISPFLFIHGDHDESVPFVQSVNLQKALKEEDNTADLISIPGGIHGTWTWHALPNVPDWEREMVVWLNKTVGHEGPIGAGIEARTLPAAK